MALPWYLQFLIVAALLVVPFAVGAYLARQLRMRDYGWKIGLILCVALVAAVVTYRGWPPKLGIDLRGGVILVYEVDQSKLPTGQKVDKKMIDNLITAITRRVNPGGQKEVVIRPYGQQQIEIIIPEGGEEARRIERLVSRAGTLEFRILANTRDHKSIIDRAKVEQGDKVYDGTSPPNLVGWWVPLMTGDKPGDVERVAALLRDPQTVSRTVKQGGKEVEQILVVRDEFDVTGAYLDAARPEADEKGQPAVMFHFNAQGGRLFGGLTGANRPDEVQNFYRKLGIILDGKLYSAPRIMTTIHDRGQITGSFTKVEVQDLVNVLNAGSLPTSLKEEPISRLESGPTLGRDTIQKSGYAMILSSILVPLFMLWYYRFSGLVANIALVLNMLVLLAIMIAIQAPLTLTGLAGLALTVGMAVDNNVLVYERLREEMEHGATLRMAIRNAFHRASATIIDANLTTLLAATILYWIGSDQVKGFAVTLWLGVAMSVFTAVFVARVIFDIAERQRWITRLKMLRLIGHTNIDFMGLFPYCAALSVLITLGGLLVAYQRGVGLFDIDFTGGVSVQALFSEPLEPNYVRQRVESVGLPDVAVSDVRIEGEPENLRYVINTSETSFDVVKGKLVEVFGKKLVYNSLSAKNLSTIKPEKAAATPAEKPAATPKAKEQARRDLPADTMLAWSGSAPMLLAQADASKEEPGSEPGAAPEEKPVAEEKPASERASPEQKPAPAETADPNTKPAPKDEAAPEQKPAPGSETPAKEAAAAATPEAAPKSAPSDVAKPSETTAKPAEAVAKPAETPAKPTEPAKPAETPAKPAEESPETTAKQPNVEAAPPVEASPALTSPFVGGTQAQLVLTVPVDQKTVEDLLNAAMEKVQVVPPALFEVEPAELSGAEAADQKSMESDIKGDQSWNVKIQLSEDKAKAVFDAAEKQLASAPFFPASDTIGGAVAEGTRYQAVYALVLSWVAMIIYLWVRFQRVAFGVAAVVALIHDVFVILGAIALSYYVAPYLGFLGIDQFKINLTIIAAFLTIIGYSVNDTIVVFDRIREVRGKSPVITGKMVNDSINQTLSRTLLTSFTVFLVVVILYMFGGVAIRGFAFALIVGVATGTYSSIYVAAPILLWLAGTKEPAGTQTPAVEANAVGSQRG